MPKKDRPSPLSENIFRAKLEKDVPGVPEEEEAIPVHNTFIQFGAPEDESPEKKHLATAPAWIGPSFQSVMQSAMAATPAPEVPAPTPSQPSEPPILSYAEGAPPGMPPPEWSSTTESPKKLASPKKVPVMRYSLSASSARAAGIGCNAVVAHYEQPAQDDEEGDEDDEDDDGNSDDRPKRPPVPPGELPSVGSAKHEEGLCKRCCFFPKGRCQNDKECEFCHYDHEKRKRKKKKKGSKQKEETDSDDDNIGVPVGHPPPLQPAPGATALVAASGQVAGGHAQHAQGLQLAAPPSGLELQPPPADFSPYDPAIWGAPTPQEISPLRGGVSGPPLTAPPSLPPRGLPVPSEPPPPAPFLGQQSQAFAITSDPYYANAAAQPLPQSSGLDPYAMPGYGARGYGEPPGYGAYGAGAGAPGYAAAGLQQANGTGLAAAQGYSRAVGSLPPPR